MQQLTNCMQQLTNCMQQLTNCLCSALLMTVLVCTGLFAQGTAQIDGKVSDQTGAVLPGAEISATHTDTGIVRDALSDEAGTYVLQNLPVGPYRLEVGMPGFKTFVQSGIVLQVGGNPVVNVVLEVGQVSEQVEVQANATMVETRATGIGQVIENTQILELPLIGRQVTDLIVLAGAATEEGTTSTNNRGVAAGTASFSIAGGLAGGNNYTLDGAFHNDVYASLGLPLPFPDAIQEFRVETSAVGAQSGYRSGGSLNSVTKSGANDFHGSLFEFLRNDRFNARNPFATSKGTLRRNQFGGTIGGPIQQNRAFFFFGYQGTIQRSAPAESELFVPTQAMLNGDFTTIASTVCRTTALNLSTPFSGNRVDPGLFSPAAKKLVSLMPAAEDECGRVQYNTASEQNDHQYVTKVDYQLTPTHSLFARHLANKVYQPNGYDISSGPNGEKVPAASGSVGTDQLVQSAAVGSTYIFGNLVNSFRANWNRTAVQKVRATFFGAKELGVNIYQDMDKYFSISFSGGNAFSLGGQSASPNKYRTVVVSLSDDVSLVRGNHQSAFGVTLMGFESNTNSLTNTSGIFSFNAQNTGLNMGDFLLGKVQTFFQGGPSTLWVNQKYFSLYAADSWKPWSNVVVTSGLRWEPYFPQQFNKQSKMLNYFNIDAFKAGVRTAQYNNAPAGMFYPGDPLFGENDTTPMYKQWRNFAPRIGLSWDPKGDGGTVIRAAYGIFFNPGTVELNLTTGQGPPWASRVNRNDVSFDDPWKDFPGGNPLPFKLSADAPFPVGGVMATFEHETQVPTVQQWNLAVQKQLSNDLMVSASYIGNLMVHLYGAREVNPAIYFPGSPVNGVCTDPVSGYTVRGITGTTCSTTANTNQRRFLSLLDPTGEKKANTISTMMVWDDGATRSYNGLILSVNKRLSRSFSLTGNYTWSHCIGNPTNTFFQTGTGGSGVMTYYQIPGATRAYDRGNCIDSGTDIRHNVNATNVISMPRFSNVWLDRLASSWRLSTILRMQSGDYQSVTTGSDIARTGSNTGTQRVNQVLPNVYGNKCFDDLRGNSPKCVWLNPAAFQQVTVGQYGNMSPGTIVSPGSWTVSMGVTRFFEFKDNQRIEFRTEATNALNHTNYGNPNTNITSANFGRITTASAGRVMQFGLKYMF